MRIAAFARREAGKVPRMRLMFCLWVGVIVAGVVLFTFVGLDHR
jgi:hypothetical protein